MKHEDLTSKIIACTYKVHNTLGFGFLELKSVKELHPAHSAQLINYLKATVIEIGLLINFGESVQIKRKILSRP